MLQSKVYLPTVLILFFCSLHMASWGQEAPSIKPWAAQLSFQQQALVIQPDVGQLGVLHDVKLRPRFAVDVQRYLTFSEKERVFASAELSYYNDLYHARWLGLQLGIGYEMSIGKRIFTAVRLQVGLARAKNSDIRYRYEEGKWVRTANEDRAKANLLIGPRLDVGYRLLQGTVPLDLVLSSHVTSNSGLGFLLYYGIGGGVRLHF